MSAPGAAGPGAPFPQWTVSSENNQVGEVTNATEKAMAEAAVFPWSLTFFTSQAAADAYVKANGGGVDTSKSPLQTGANVVGSAANTAVGAIKNPQGFLGNIANFFGDLSQASTWIRIAKVVIGAVLVFVGTAHLTGADKAALKAAPLLA